MYPTTPSALIVDDDEDVCFLLSKLLTTQKIKAATAHTLEQAKHCMEEVRPQIILLDNNLPDGLGIDFLEYIKSQHSEVKVIMITADTKVGVREKAINNGADRFLAKPFDAEKIIAEVKALLDLTSNTLPD